MATAKLTAVVTTKGVTISSRELQKFSKDALKAEKRNRGLASSFKGLIPAVSAATAVFAGIKIAKYADQYTNLENKLALATESLYEHEAATKAVFDISQKTRVSVASTADLYFRLSKSTKELGVSQKNLFDFTELINQTLAISGSSAQAADAAIIQLGQGLSAGALRGQEFNSVVEQAPRLAQALSDALGVNIGQLRGMAEQGELTSSVIVNALASQSKSIQDEFSKIEPTISGTIQKLTNSTTYMVGAFDDFYDASGAAVSGIELLVDGVDLLAESIGSGQFDAYLTANASRFDSWAGDVAYTLSVVDGLYSEFAMSIGSDSDDLTDSVISAFSNMPENIRAFIQIMSVELAAFVQKTSAYGTEILENIKFWEDESFDLEARLKILDDVRIDSISTILQERDAGVSSFRDQVKEADSLLDKYKELQSGKPAVDLAQFAVLPEAANDPSGDAKLQKQKELAQKQLEQFIQLNNTELEEVDRVESERLAKIQDYRDKNLIALENYESAKTEIESNAQKKRDDIAENLRKKAVKDEEERRATIRSVGEGVLSDLATIGGKQSKFLKAQAKVNAVIKTYESANSAYAALAPIPIVGPALGAAAAGVAIAAGLANVRAIDSAREQGGMLASGQTSTVAERGLEILTPANASRVRTANDMRNIMGENQSSPNVNIVVIDQSEGSKEFDQSTDDDGRIVLLIRNTVSGDIGQSNSQISKSITANTTAQRNRA